MALAIRNNINKSKYSEDDILFKYIIGDKFNSSDFNRFFASFVKDMGISTITITAQNGESLPVDSITKTVIKNMIECGGDLAYIAKVSGIKIAQLESTYEKEIFVLSKRNPDINQSINWNISQSDYYHYI